jgi:type IV pilus assembly protein PilB
MKAMPLGQILIDEGIISTEQLEQALVQQRATKKRLGVVLTELGFATEKDILRPLAKRLGVDYLESPIFTVELDAVRLVPESLAKRYTIVPVNIKAGTLTIASNDPLDFACLEDVGMITGLEIKTVLSPQSEIEKAIQRVYTKRSADNIMENLKDEYGGVTIISTDQDAIDDANMAERVDSAPIVKLVNSLIMEAYQQNASDIHIEPEEHFTRIRMRIDGDLQIHNELSSEAHNLIVTRIKIISGMNIAEKRIPQDGAFQFRNDVFAVDIRVSSLPTAHGEKVVMRLLGADRNITYDLASLGLSDYTQRTIEKAIRFPHGILLVTGPTGSGKTTTLYSMLSKMADPKKNIITVEDPIERKFEGINQVHVNARAGLTFAGGLRSILRQDPDIIMVGEIRDGETAEIAIRAAITGHFVLSTIHTNDALSTVVRLIDMGIEPFLVASSVKCVMSQRLVKKICPHCKTLLPVTSSDNLLLRSNLEKAYVGKGCQHCNKTGYSGRTAVFEIILIDSHLEELIAKRASMEQLKAYASEKKMRMLRDEVMELIEKGLTSVEEGIRILYSTE